MNAFEGSNFRSPSNETVSTGLAGPKSESLSSQKSEERSLYQMVVPNGFVELDKEKGEDKGILELQEYMHD